MNEPFLRIPPFPGHRAGPITLDGAQGGADLPGVDRVLDLLRARRVGGSFWAGRPALPEGRDILLAPASDRQASEMTAAARRGGLIDRCLMLSPDHKAIDAGIFPGPLVEGPVDPWFLASGMKLGWVGAELEQALVLAIERTPLRLFGEGRFRDVGTLRGLRAAIENTLGRGRTFRCPFTGETISVLHAIEQLSGWRDLIDRNRSTAAVTGVASWKRPTVDPLLWSGTRRPAHASRVPLSAEPGSTIVAWKSRTSPRLVASIARCPLKLAEIEDGMIRGVGLGANCVPPLSVIVDNSGIYFDPSGPSDLEDYLESATIDDELISRARKLRSKIIDAGISKYGAGAFRRNVFEDRARYLVIGQVEDDRSVLTAGGRLTNLDLLVRARELEPQGWLVYRPHPDVEAGHRKGHIPDAIVMRHADEIDRDAPIGSLIQSVAGVHTISSLAGFEALLRGKPVTAHGVPFYAGWGLTRDLGSVPERRRRRRSLDELVAAALILYPRYIDPRTLLPCPPEVLVDRIASGQVSVSAPLSAIRKLQGRLKLMVRDLKDRAA